MGRIIRRCSGASNVSNVPSRRTFLGLIAASGVGSLAGCSNVLDSGNAPGDSTTSTDGSTPTDGSGKPAHTVTVYLVDEEVPRDVTVTVEESDGTVVFERSYALSEDNESHEDATFPASSDPHTVVVSVDDAEFERPWPGRVPADDQCHEGNWEGVEVWIRGGPDESPSVRLKDNCQHVTLD